MLEPRLFLCALLFSPALLNAQAREKPVPGKKAPAQVLADYLKTRDPARRKEILVKELKDLGLPLVRAVQDAMDALLPCYKAARAERKKLKRRKEPIPPVPAERVEALVDQVVRLGKKPDPTLKKAGALAGLRKALGLLDGLRFFLLRPKVLAFIQAQAATGAAYSGQYLPLKKKYGRAAVGVLLEMALDKRAMEEDMIRIFAARALADMGEAEPALLQALGGLAADEYEARDLRRQAAVTLARLGEREALEPFLEEAKKQAARKNPKARVRGWQTLAGLWHDIGEHAKAVECYSRALPIVKELVKGKAWPPDVLATIYYNRACSLAALGKKKEAAADLEAAMASGGISIKTLENDKELDPLRKDPAFRKLLEQARKKRR